MIITVKLFAAYQIDRFREKRQECPADSTVGQVLERLNIPESSRGIILVNGRRVERHHLLQEGDALTLLPLVSGG